MNYSQRTAGLEGVDTARTAGPGPSMSLDHNVNKDNALLKGVLVLIIWQGGAVYNKL